MHPNEIAVVFRTTSGSFLPTREFRKALLLEANARGRAHIEALFAQVDRQIDGQKQVAA